MMSMPVAQRTYSIRPLAAADLAAVVALDAAAEGRTRREYIERRLRAAQREPGLHAQFAAVEADGVVGFMLARVLAGEFGTRRRALRLEAMGVGAEHRGAGIGRQLFEALSAWAQRHGCAELRTTASWRDTAVLAWFDGLGFELAPEVIVHSAVEGGALIHGHDEEPGADDAHAAREIDYGRPEANDHERLARDRTEVRTMTGADLDAIVRIDRSITGRDRRDYITARLAEAMDDTSVRVSLAARCDGTVVGYLMARADLGDFGRSEPVAVIDTLGVDPDYARRGVGRAMLSQLAANLGALHVERVETIVPLRDLALLSFLHAVGFEPAQRLSFVRRLPGEGA
ncbi:MAG TPA: GNAT family N-acetyltransferase [Burkholderiaceae bacterium]|nr:GNAT family N-acetyltransferase [Burkholderiaceae bacterium]